MADEAAMEVESTRAPSERAASVAPSPSASTTALPTDSGPARQPVRPKIDLTTERGKGASLGKEPRKRAGRTMFGVVLGTLNKAKSEDKARAASEAAKKRALIDQRLQSKIARETTSVRRQEEARSKRAAAGRKQDELALKDTVIRSRMHRLPLLASFLLTSDNVPANADEVISNEDVNGDLIDTKNLSDGTRSILDAPPRGHPPPLYFLPAILLDSQRKFIDRRKKEVEAALKAEWAEFREQRDSTTAEIAELRAQAQASQAEVNAEKQAKTNADADVHMETDKDAASAIEEKGKSSDAARADDDADDVRMEDVEASKEGEDKVEY